MGRHRSKAILALAVLGVIGLAGPAAQARQVPFLGQLAGSFTVTPLTPPFVSILVSGNGFATQLGGFTLAIPHEVNRGNGTAVGTFQFTAANGDTLTADFTGQSTPTLTPGILIVVETATITGGTGRFAGATGGFIGKRLVNQNTLKTWGFFSGKVTSPRNH